MLDKKGMILMEALIVFQVVILSIWIFTSFYMNYLQTTKMQRTANDYEMKQIYETTRIHVD